MLGWNSFTFGKSKGYTWRRLQEGSGSPRYVLVAPNGAITLYDVVLRDDLWVARDEKRTIAKHQDLDTVLRVIEKKVRK